MTIQETIDAYLEHLRATRSYRTAKVYRVGLGHFLRYLTEQNLRPDAPVAALKPPLILRFLPWLQNYLLQTVADGHPDRVKPGTKSVYRAAVVGYLEYLVVYLQVLPYTLEEYDKLLKASRINFARPTEIPRDRLPSPDTVAALLRYVEQEPAFNSDWPSGERRRQRLLWLRNRALFFVLRSSGMRVSEACQLDRQHLLFEERGAMVYHGKGNRSRIVLFSPEAWTYLLEYLRERDGQTVAPAAPVFAQHNRRVGQTLIRLTSRGVQLVFERIAREAGILERFHLTPHTLRHFFATEFLSQTGDLALTQYALGHASPVTTRIYAQTKFEDYRTAHRSLYR